MDESNGFIPPAAQSDVERKKRGEGKGWAVRYFAAFAACHTKKFDKECHPGHCRDNNTSLMVSSFNISGVTHYLNNMSPPAFSALSFAAIWGGSGAAAHRGTGAGRHRHHVDAHRGGGVTMLVLAFALSRELGGAAGNGATDGGRVQHRAAVRADRGR